MLGEKISKALGDISDEKIAAAAQLTPVRRRVWTYWVAAAAVLALLLSMGFWLWPTAPDGASISVFAVRVYAADGSVTTLGTVGESADIHTGTSDFFPGREVYIIDVILTDADGKTLDLAESSFRCFHRGKYLKPGQSDEQIHISWLENGTSGYRIVGWCAERDSLDIDIVDADGRILHQKHLGIDFDGQYHVNVRVSYNYEPELTTEELLAKVLDSGQDYSRAIMFSSSLSAYNAVRNAYGGFIELEERSDAASLLLQRWIRQMEENPQNWGSVEGSGFVGSMLAQDAHWNNLTEEEIALIESYGIRRWNSGPPSKGPFPDKQTFSYELILDGTYMSNDRLTVEYDGKMVTTEDDHLMISLIVSSAFAETSFYGWNIWGWFDEPTQITLTVTDKDGNMIRWQRLLITPTDGDYQIDLLDEIT